MITNSFTEDNYTRVPDDDDSTIEPKFFEYNRDLNTDENYHCNITLERSSEISSNNYHFWYNYLCIRVDEASNRPLNDPIYEDVNNIFEHALTFLYNISTIWIKYCEFMKKQNSYQRTIRLFDRALKALPITDHHMIWPIYIEFVQLNGTLETEIRGFEQYLKLQSGDSEDYVNYFISIEQWDEAAVHLCRIITQNNFTSKYNKSDHELWNEFCHLITTNSSEITSINVDAIFRHRLNQYPNLSGTIWTAFADYYIRINHDDCALNIYREAIQSVRTVYDFMEVFGAFIEFEKMIMNKRIERINQRSNTSINKLQEIITVHQERIGRLLKAKPLILNAIALRQNPHDVEEWHKRVQLYDGNYDETIRTYDLAVRTVEPVLSDGKMHTLWIGYSKYFEASGQLIDARAIYQRAVKEDFAVVDDLAMVWCEWAEMEVRHGFYQGALTVMYNATAVPSYEELHDYTKFVHHQLRSSLKIWSKFVDLQEKYGSFISCKLTYENVIMLDIVKPYFIMRYGVFLAKNRYFMEADAACNNFLSDFIQTKNIESDFTDITSTMNIIDGSLENIEQSNVTFDENFLFDASDSDENIEITDEILM